MREDIVCCDSLHLRPWQALLINDALLPFWMVKATP